LGHVEDETFSADGLQIIVHGIATHPGFAKGKMVNAIKVASDILHALPKDSLSPETTEKREGFIHPTGISGSMEQCTLSFIIRDFEDDKLVEYEEMLQAICESCIKKYPGAAFEFKVQQQYRNMKKIVDQHPQI